MSFFPVRNDRSTDVNQRRSGNLFTDIFGFDPLRAALPSLGDSMGLGMDVRRESGGYVIEFPVPSFRPEQIEVTLNGDTLVVSGKSERRSFTRSLTITEDIDADNISANVEHGMLTLRLKTRPETEPRRIEVQTGQGQTSIPTVSGTTRERSSQNAETSSTSMTQST